MTGKEAALDWCSRNPGWVAECDLEVEVSELYQTWDDVPEKEKQKLYDTCGFKHAYLAWRDFGVKKFKVPHLIIDEFGEVHESSETVNFQASVMSVFKVDEL